MLTTETLTLGGSERGHALRSAPELDGLFLQTVSPSRKVTMYFKPSTTYNKYHTCINISACRSQEF